MLYQHRQNGKVMEIVKQDEKRGTLIIRFTDGTTGAITSGTFKRWYTPVEKLDEEDKELVAEEVATLKKTEADYVAEVMEQKKELGIDCPPITSVEVVEPLTDLDNTVTDEEVAVDSDTCGDGTPLAEVGKEIAQQAKEKAKKAKKAAVTHEKGSKSRSSKKDDVTTSETLETRVKQLQDVLTALGYEVKVGTDKKLVAKATGKRTMHFYVGLRKAVLGFAKDNVPEGMVADRVRNCAISHSFDITYDNLETLKKFM